MPAQRKTRPKRRTYRLQKRGEQQDETRRRIVEAVVELHRTVGPARTTVTEVAEMAGVGRMTVYNHFPTEGDLIGACSAHWSAANPIPDAEAWLQVEDPAKRLHDALLELYPYYRRSEDMLGKIFRDEPLIPALGEVMREAWWPAIDAMVDVLGRGRRLRGKRKTRFEAALRLVLDFSTWRTLSSELGDGEAAEVGAAMVEATA